MLWNLGTLAYQLLHILRQRALTGAWKVASPDRIRQWLIRMPATCYRHARKRYLQLRRDEPLRLRFLKALRRLDSWDPPPLAACF